MEYEAIKNYWNERANEFKTSPEATTNDYFMRQIEINSLKSKIKKYEPILTNVADIGCGNGYSTIELAKTFPNIKFFGFDYSSEMIKHANANAKNANINNIFFNILDIVDGNLYDKYDLIYTDRCLINLPSWDNQKLALKKISNALSENGIYLMIENFLSGQSNLNLLREQFGLSPINIREHNLFFNLEETKEFIKELGLNFLYYENISSLYYLVSRVIYSKICSLEGKKPDYYDIHHELASKLPISGDFGPTVMCEIRKGIYCE